MQAPIAILLIAASLVLMAEFLMAAVAGLVVFQPGVDRFAHLTGMALSPPVYRLLGLLALLGVAGIVAGARWPALAIAGAAYFALVAGFTLLRQVQRGQRGRELLPYTLFLVSALLVITITAAFRSG